jgi:DNA-binding HxlR family transcriptional regulator
MQVTYCGNMHRASLTALVPCPIGRTLEIVGEWWTLLIVRDALFGARKFEEFKTTGIADNILTARLKKLTAAGILERRLYQRKPPRYEYVLTEKGRALAPVVLALRTWGRQFTRGDESSAVVHDQCGQNLAVGAHCEHCGRDVAREEVKISSRFDSAP